jgi:hypothetical protein
MTEQERKHVTDLLDDVILQVRRGKITHARIDEMLCHLQWLLDHPGWQVNRVTNELEAT